MLRGRRLSRYIFWSLLPPTLVGLLLFTFLLLMNALFLLAEEALSRGWGWELTLRLLALQLPRLLVLTVPMAVLLGALIELGRLSADHEWVAIQSAGLGVGFLLRPVLAFGMALTLLGFGLYGFVFPRTNYTFRVLQRDALLASRLGANLRPRVFYTGLYGGVLFVDEIRPGTQGSLEGVLLHRSRGEGGFEELIVARKGDLYSSPDRPGVLEMDLHEGVLHAYRAPDPDPYRVFRFGSYHLEFDPPPYLQAFQGPVQKGVQDLDLRQLLVERREARAEPQPVLRAYRVRRAEIEFHQRLALPAASLLFCLLAVPLGLTRARSGKGAGFALAIVVIVLYRVVFVLTRDQALAGRISPALGVWAANALILAWALVGLWRMRRGGVVRTSTWAEVAAGLFRWFRRRRQPAADSPAREPESPAGDTWRTLPANRWIGLLDRYIAGRYLRTLALALAGTYVVYAIVELQDLLDGLLKNRQPASAVLEYFQYATPGMLSLVLPVSVLVGGVVCFTVMARLGELVAVIASGVSVRRAAVPVVVLTGMLCGGFFLLQERVVPVSSQKAEQIKDRILGRSPRTYGLQAGGRWVFGTSGRLYHYALYDPALQRFQGLHVFSIDRDRAVILSHRYAVYAQWKTGRWELGTGWLRRFDPEEGAGELERFEAGVEVVLDPPEDFERSERTLLASGDLPEQMDLLQLREQIHSLRRSGYDTTRLEVAWHQKLAQPLTPLVMLLLGLPFAFRIGRKGSLYGLGVALVLVIVYWATFAVFRALGLETLLPPALAAWAPNVLYSLLGLYLLLQVRT